MWKSAYVDFYQLLNWKMHGETLKTPFWPCSLPYLQRFVLLNTPFFNKNMWTQMYLIYKSRFVVICSCASFPLAPYLFKYLGHKTPIWGNDNFRRIFLALQVVDISLSLFFGGNIYTHGTDFCMYVYEVQIRVWDQPRGLVVRVPDY